MLVLEYFGGLALLVVGMGTAFMLIGIGIHFIAKGD